MTPAQSLAVKMSEARSRVNELALDDDADPSALEDAAGELEALEKRHRALIRAGGPDPEADALATAEAVESEPEADPAVAELRSRVSPGTYLRAALAGKDIPEDSPEAELRSAMNLPEPTQRGGVIVPVELGPPELRAVTVASSGQDGQLAQEAGHLPRIFAPAVTGMMGSRMRAVDHGRTETVRVHTGFTAESKAEEAAAAESNFAETTYTFSPDRLTANAEVTVEALAAGGPDFEAALVLDLANEINDKLEARLLTGTGANNQPTGLMADANIAEDTDANAAGTFAELASMADRLIDGIHAGQPGHISVAASPTAHAHVASVATASGEVFAIDRLERRLRSWMVSAHLPTLTITGGTDYVELLAYRGRPGVDLRAHTCAVWGGLEIVVDGTSKIKQGLVVITGLILFDAVTTRPAAYHRPKVSA